MDIKAEKIKLIEWLVGLEDAEVISKLNLLRASSLAKLTNEEKAAIDEGLKSVEEGRVKYHAQVGGFNKNHLMAQLKKFPENFSLDFLIDRLVFLKKVETGLDQSSRGEGVSDEEMEKVMQTWFK